MTNLNFEFGTFYRHIGLSASQKKTMFTLRQSLRSRIRHYFQHELNLRPPAFFSLGRQATATALAPTYGEIVMEEGVLLQHLPRDIILQWPEPDVVHVQMLGGVQDHTPDPPIDKMHSVCVQYRGLYKIEISILAPGPDGNLLAIHDVQGWQPCHQEPLAAWFKNQIKHHGLQLRRVASYLHAWADFHPNGLDAFAWRLPLDILAARYFQADIERDDNSLSRTAAAILESAHNDRTWPIPFAKDYSLPWFLSQEENRQFFESLEVLIERSHCAVTTKDKTRACAVWRSLLGDRFPLAETSNRLFDPLLRDPQPRRCYSRV